MSSRRIFVAGCGFVGLPTARLFHSAGWEVIGGTHSAESADALAGEPFQVTACDISSRDSVAALGQKLGKLDAVIHCASSGRGGAESYQRVYLEGCRNLAAILRPKALLFTSSTSVYAQVGGETVTEESAAEPDRETGRILRQTEDLVLSYGGIVARLAGIYGPGRSVLLKKFFSGEAVIEGDGSRWINQVHRDDIASALFTLLQSGVRGVFNVSDNTPVSQRALYEWLAARFERPVPPTGPIDTNRKRGWTHKRVSNAKLRALGWEPKYPSFFDAVDRDQKLVAAVASSAHPE